MEENNIVDKFNKLNNQKSGVFTLTSDSLLFDNRGLFKTLREDIAPTQWSVDNKLAEKYNKYGLAFNPKDYYSGSLDTQLAETQSNWAKAGNALLQSVVSEIGLGIVGGGATILDLIGMAVTDQQLNYDNTLTSKVEEWRETFRNEVAPIYSRPGSGFENGTDFGWWMQNVPSVFSSLTLLVPSTALAKGVGLVGKVAMKGVSKGIRKGSKMASKWANKADNIKDASKLRKALTPTAEVANKLNLGSELLTTAAISRTLENYQESLQVFDEQTAIYSEEFNRMSPEEYNKLVEAHSALLDGQGVDKSNKNEVAKALAREAANTTFKADYANVIFDLIQLGTIRNIGFKLFNKTQANAAAKRLEKNSRKFAGQTKSLEDVKRLVKEQSFKKRAWDKTKDVLKDVGLFGLTQGTEGIEEAINYIASQEGFYVGKTLLDVVKESDHPLVFTDRLLEYTKHPELYESAFWGVVGGIIFGGGTSLISNAKLAKQQRKDQNAKTDEKTGERTKGLKNAINSFWVTPDLKRIENSIENRFAIENAYKTKIESISKGFNPDTKEKIKSDEERNELFAQAIEDRRNVLVLNAMDSGTIDMLEAYLTDENVQKALVDNGVMKQEDVKTILQEDLKAIEEIKEIYNRQAKHINNASKNIYMKDGEMIPMDYLQIIARENIEKIIKDKRYNKLLNELNIEANALKEQLKDKLNPNYDYATMITLNRYTALLGELTADRKELLADKETSKSISGIIALQEIDKQIEDLKDKIVDLDKENSFRNLLYGLEQAARTQIQQIGDKTYYVNKSTKESKNINDIINSKDLKRISELDKRIIKSIEGRVDENNIEDILHRKKVYEQDMRYALSEDSTDSLIKTSAELAKLYAAVTEVSYNMSRNKAKMYLTDEEIKTRASQIHNEMQELRRTKVNNALPLVMELAERYGADNIRNIITARFNNENINTNDSGLSEEDLKQLLDALDVLNLSTDINKPIYSTIDVFLSNYDKIKEAESKTKENLNEGVTDDNFDKSNNVSKETKSPQNKNKKAEILENIERKSYANEQTKTLLKHIFSNIDFNQTINKIVDKDLGVDITITTDNSGNYTLQFNDENTTLNWYNNEDLFSIQEGANILNNNYAVASNPTISSDGNVKTGNIVSKDVQQSTDVAPITDDVPPTEGLEKITQQPLTTDNVPGEVEEDLDAELLTKTKTNANRKLRRYINNAIENNNDIDIEGFIEENKENWKNNVNNEEDLNEVIRYIRGRAEKLLENKDVKPFKNVLDLVVKHSKIVENPKNDDVKKDFYKSIEDVLNDLKSFIKVIDGNRYVNIEALCRYCNNMIYDEPNTQNTDISQEIVNDLIDYAKNTKDIIITDEDINAIENNIKHRDPVKDELFSKINIGFNDLLREADNEYRKELEKVIDKLQPNDELEVNIESTHKKQYIVFKKDDITLGVLPIPSSNLDSNGYTQINDGWVTDINLANNESKLKNLFIEWITNPNNDADIKRLNDVIYIYAYNKENLSLDELYNLIEEFSKNKVIAEAVKNGYTSPNTNSSELLQGLVKLWKYANSKQTFDEDIDTILRNESIEEWFDKVRSSFDFIQQIQASVSNNSNIKVLIDTITEGELIFSQEPVPVQDAIGSDHKNDIRLAVALTDNELTVAKDGINGNKKLSFNAKKGSTFIVIPSRAGNHSYVQAYAQTVNSDSISNEAKAIKADIKSHIDNILHSGKTSEEIVYDLEKFIRSIINAKDNNRGILQNRLFRSNPNQICYITDNYLRDRSTKNGAVIYTKNSFDNNVKPNAFYITTQNLHNITSTAIMKLIDDYCSFNISFDGITSNFTNDNNVCKRNKDGKFTITIGNEIREYDSYNDFMIDNNLISVRTQTRDGKTNFTRITNSDKTTQNITVKVASVETTPVEDMEQVDSTESNIIKSVEDIINNKRILNKGLHIVNKVLGFNFKDNAKFNEKDLNLFPKNIIFVNENVGGNAAANPYKEPLSLPDNKDIIIQPGQVIIGKEWIKLAKVNPSEAYRKLIHEQLHLHLAGDNKKYVEQVREIYDEFVKSLDNADNETKQRLEKYKLNDFILENGTISLGGLEEFLVESLTSKELANYLNSVEVEVKDTKGKKSILQRLMELITKILDIDIKKGTLYEQEFNALRDVFEDYKENHQEEIKEDKKDDNESTNLLNVSDLDIEPDFSRIVEDEYTSEMQDIKDKAIADGTFMKAPNGNPTNLNERQWVHVRTKAFKDWFGDWENNPSEASKVVDENGEPLVVYHGSDNIFDEFLPDIAIYTTNSKSMADSYYYSDTDVDTALDDFETKEEDYSLTREGDYERALLLLQQDKDFIRDLQMFYPNEINPLISDFEEFIGKYYSNYAEIETEDINHLGTIYKIRYDKIPKEEHNSIANAYAEYETPTNPTDYYRRKITGDILELFNNLKNPLIVDAEGHNWNHILFNGEYLSTRDIEDYAKSHNYDGFIVKNVTDYGGNTNYENFDGSHDIYVVFKPNQVKSATDNIGSYSNENNNIKYSTIKESATSNVESFIDEFDLSERAEIIRQINDSEIQISCK